MCRVLGRVSGSALAVLVLAATSACSVLRGGAGGDGPERESTAEIVRVVHAPIDARRFAGIAADTEVLGALQMVYAAHEDTFADLAREHDLGYQEMRAANPDVDPWLPGAGTPVYLPTLMVVPDAPRDGVVVNLPAMRLFEFERAVGDAGSATGQVFTHPIGIGREGWATPTGSLRVIEKVRDPKWYPPQSVRAEHAALGDPLPAVVPPGPDNPLGRFKIRLSNPNYLIHGTNRPPGVGMRVSHGCIRLYPEDIAPLFERLALDTPVHIVDQPVLAGWRDGELYLEVHPPLAEDERDLTQLAQRVIAAALARSSARGVAVDAALVARIVRDRQGIPIPVTRTGLTPSAYLGSARLVRSRLPQRAAPATASRSTSSQRL